MEEDLCPVCNNPTLEKGEMIDVGFGYHCGVKGSPDRCHTCGFVEAGCDPTDPPFEYFKKCWELQVDPWPPMTPAKHRKLDIRYIEWIRNNVPDHCLGLCFKKSVEMHIRFPELNIVRGHYYCLVWGQRDHYWLIDEEGFIIDPTVNQFPTKNGVYSGRVISKEELDLLRKGIE